MNMMKLSLAALFLTGAMAAGAEHLGSVDKTLIDSTYTPGEDRSEERRVGKECRL